MVSFDSVLNFAIPALLVLVALGFVYTKFLAPFVIPMFVRMWQWATRSKEESNPDVKIGREITYDSSF